MARSVTLVVSECEGGEVKKEQQQAAESLSSYIVGLARDSDTWDQSTPQCEKWMAILMQDEPKRAPTHSVDEDFDVEEPWLLSQLSLSPMVSVFVIVTGCVAMSL
jgi:hypothetical protein